MPLSNESDYTDYATIYTCMTLLIELLLIMSCLVGFHFVLGHEWLVPILFSFLTFFFCTHTYTVSRFVVSFILSGIDKLFYAVTGVCLCMPFMTINFILQNVFSILLHAFKDFGGYMV